MISLLVCSCGCVVSLAPAYRIDKESDKIEFRSGPVPQLQLTVSYALENYGTSVLPFIDVTLPNEARYRIKNLLFKVDGRTVRSVQVSSESQEEGASKFRVPFDPGWNPKQRRELEIEYTFNAQEGSDARLEVAAASFYVISPGWLPLLQPPSHPLSPFPGSPVRTTYAIQVPADFLVLASGKPLGQKKNGGMMEYRFEWRKNDLAPYIVAGRYVDNSSSRQARSASFWTFEALKDNPATAEKETASVSDILQKNFGARNKNGPALHIVESAGRHAAGSSEFQAIPFPVGVLVNSPALALGVNTPDFLKLVTKALVRNRFANISSPNSALGISEGLPAYADIVINEGLNGQGVRRELVLKVLHEYNEACQKGVEKPLISTTMQDPIEQRRIALAKAPLFFIALEDIYGEEPVRRGLAQVVSLLRGQEIKYQDIRAALENETNKDLSPMFRIWLYQTGIPAGFKEKYEGAQAGKD